MNNTSFYGGRRGASFVIAGSFASKAEMIANFKLGAQSAINYEEYVLIDCIDKNNPEHGQLYRRGYDYTNPTTGGAEYIGNISGGSGYSITNVRLNTGEQEGQGDQKIYVTINDDIGERAIGLPINYIMKTAVTPDYHLLFLHSDPARRAEVVAQGKSFSFEGIDDWEDMGVIGSSGGGGSTVSSGAIIGKEDDPLIVEQAEKLPNGSIWFVVEER